MSRLSALFFGLLALLIDHEGVVAVQLSRAQAELDLADEPQPVQAVAKPQPVAVAKPQPVAVAKPPAVAKPQPAAVAKPQPVAVAKPQPAAVAKPQPAAVAKPSTEDGDEKAEAEVAQEIQKELPEAKSVVLKASGKPHLILFLADDMGWNGVGYNNPELKTPGIDKLAREGVILESFYSGSICAPSRFSLLTGRSPWKSEGFGTINLDPKFPVGTNLGYDMLPAVLKNAGYKTHAVGKWHQGYHRAEYLPTNRGFDTYYGILEGSSGHFSQGSAAISRCHGKSTVDLTDGDQPANNTGEDFSKSTTLGDFRYRERAVQIINEHNPSEPMFLYVSSQMPHTPFEISAEYEHLYHFGKEQNVYYGMISHLDDTIMAVRKALEDNNMYTNSLIVFMSDNGAAAESPEKSNFPMQGHKGQVLEGGIHVPAFVSGGLLPSSQSGKKSKELVSIADWYATFAAMAGVEAHMNGPTAVDGANQWPYLSGAQSTGNREDIIQMHPSVAWLSGSAKNECAPGTGAYALIRGQYKLLYLSTQDQSLSRTRVSGGGIGECRNEACLFDLSKDPYEEENVAEDNQDIVNSMQDKADQYIREASKAEWFGRVTSDHVSSDICEAWQNTGSDDFSFVVPWSSGDVEHNFVSSSKQCVTKFSS